MAVRASAPSRCNEFEGGGMSQDRISISTTDLFKELFVGYDELDDEDRAVYYQYIEEIKTRIAALEAALKEIRDHPHIQPGVLFPTDNLEWAQGYVEGLRLDAEIARKALEGRWTNMKD
jgi:hypothetical protein